MYSPSPHRSIYNINIFSQSAHILISAGALIIHTLMGRDRHSPEPALCSMHQDLVSATMTLSHLGKKMAG